MVYWSAGSLVGWFTGQMVHWSTGSLVSWFTGQLVHWSTGSLVNWFTSQVVGSMVNDFIGQPVRLLGPRTYWFGLRPY